MKMSLLNGVMQRMGGGVAVALLAAGALGGATAQAAGIKDTKHNLSTSNGITGANKLNGDVLAGNTEICVFCHTPHGSDTSASVPLWNKKLNSTGYTTYNSLGTSSLDGVVAAVGSVSMACLSCHDGTQALNVMINSPGSGGFTAGVEFGTMTGDRVTANKLSAGIITNLGQDLKNDHPVGVQYAGGPKSTYTIPAAGTDYAVAGFRDSDFKVAKSMKSNGQTVWWVDTTNGIIKGGTVVAGAAGVREKTDMQLYTRTEVTSATDTALLMQPFVECASCHDPHSDNTTFLRIENSESAVCLACHTK